MAQYQTVAPWIRFEWNTRASADVSSRWQTRAKLECLLIENWEARNGVGSGTAIHATFQGQSFGFHMISQSEPPHLPSWISKCQRHLNLRDIGRIHFFSFMLLVDQLNGCLCLSMGSTYPCKGGLLIYNLEMRISGFFNISCDRPWEISFGWGADASFSSQDWEWTGRWHMCIFLKENDVDTDMFRQKSNSDSYPTMFRLL